MNISAEELGNAKLIKHGTYANTATGKWRFAAGMTGNQTLGSILYLPYRDTAPHNQAGNEFALSDVY